MTTLFKPGVNYQNGKGDWYKVLRVTKRFLLVAQTSSAKDTKYYDLLELYDLSGHFVCFFDARHEVDLRISCPDTALKLSCK